MIIKIVLSILFITTAFVSEAHVHSHAVEDIEHIEKLYGLAVTLSPHVLDSVDTSSAQPYIKIGGKYVLLNTGFWQLVQGWVRLYRREIEQYCPCDIDEQKLVQEARDEIARGFVNTKITRKISNFGEFVIVGAYGLSARYGKAALLLKAAAEVAEHTLSIFLGGKGVHVICNVIDAMILFIFRKSQIYVRVFNNSKTLDQSRFLSVMRLAWLRRLMKKKNKSVFLYLQSAEIDGHALDHVNEEGAKVRLFRWTVKKDQREKWVRSLSQKMEPILNRTREIDAQLENESLSAEDRRKLLKERRKLVKKSEELTQIFRKSFFGKRYGLSLWLLTRKWSSQYLNGETLADRVTSKDFIWPLGLQENILERALIRQVEEAGLMQDHSTLRLPPDEIRTGLAEEFAEKMRQANTTGHVHSIERVLMDVEKIFDPSLKMAERYLIVSIIESGFLGLFEFYLLRVMYPELIQSTEGLNLWGRARLRWRLDRFIYYVFMYSDFLRTVAVIKDPSKINSYKYESMEAFLNLFEYLHQVSKLPREAHTKESLLARLDEHLYRVQSFQPQFEKRTTFRWIRIPFIRPLPMCRSLVRVAQ